LPPNAHKRDAAGMVVRVLLWTSVVAVRVLLVDPIHADRPTD
jgi:hypothetical protein